MTDGTNTYKRNQVEWALWRHIAGRTGDDLPTVLKTRVKRLLEIDRETYRGSGEFAFSEGETSGQGTDASFKAFDVFCLAVALHLMHAGIKQSRVAFLVHDVREHLQGIYYGIMSRPAPKARAGNFRDAANDDPRVFAVFRNVDMAKDLSSSDQPRIRLRFREPEFCNGITSLLGVLNRMDTSFQQAIVIELACMAHSLEHTLKMAPVARRGRQ